MIRVIIVEDEPVLRESMAKTTDWASLECELVFAASNAFEGETQIRLLEPDIVITDITMPERTGLEMIECLGTDVACEYIIISGYDEFEYAQKALDLGAKAYLLKPVDDDELIRVMKKVIQTVLAKKQNATPQLLIEKAKYANTDLALLDDSNQQYQARYLKQFFEILRSEYASDLTLKKVSAQLHISESYAARLIKSLLGFTFLEVLTYWRMSEAIRLLDETDLRVYEISEAVGYHDSRYFSNVFSKIVGVNPADYRKAYELSDGHVLRKFQSYMSIE